MQRRQAVFALCVDVGAVVDQELGEDGTVRAQADGVVEGRAAGDAGLGSLRGGRVDVGGVGQGEDETDEGFVAFPGSPLQGGDAMSVLGGEFMQIGGEEEGEMSARLQEAVCMFGGEQASDEIEHFIGEVEEVHCGEEMEGGGMRAGDAGKVG